MGAPGVDRPDMPDGYGVPDTVEGTLEWPSVEERLAAATHYWVATTRQDGRPHVVPRWGVWWSGRFWYDGSPETVHARNLVRNAAMTLHLESGAQAVILEGVGRASEPLSLEQSKPLAEQFAAKYENLGYAPEPDSWAGPDAGGMVVFRPVKGLAWFRFPDDVTRFRFGD